SLFLGGCDEKRGNVMRPEILVQDVFLYEVHAVHVALQVRHLERAPAAVCEGNMSVAANHREEMSALHRLARGQTQRSKRPSMERACETENSMFSRMPLGKFHRSLNRLCA